ncbi:MAG: NUDIX hydrolase [Candidatus Kerfeldbacteria bacterium]|nr:NUDIX hydrolase [Candidatus Kerfeldbacteria bacterium]
MTLTPKQISTCAKLLEQLEPGFLPFEIFSQISRLVRLPVVNVIPVRQEASRIQIGLIKRENDDPWWPGRWHLPGTVILSTDTMNGAIQRLLKEEIVVTSSDQPVFHTIVVQHTKRGAGLVLVYSVRNCVLPETSPIHWFSVDDLPEQLVESELEVIEKLKQDLNIHPKI